VVAGTHPKSEADSFAVADGAHLKSSVNLM
jgi:hypothetical protein